MTAESLLLPLISFAVGYVVRHLNLLNHPAAPATPTVQPTSAPAHPLLADVATVVRSELAAFLTNLITAAGAPPAAAPPTNAGPEQK